MAYGHQTHRELAVALKGAKGREDDPDPELLNEICGRIEGLSLDETEQGLTPKAWEKIDAFVAEHSAPITIVVDGEPRTLEEVRDLLKIPPDHCVGCWLGDASPDVHDYGYGCDLGGHDL